MNALTQILNWLSTKPPRNFNHGAKLYNKFGSNIFLKKRFNLGANSYNRSLLFNELKNLANDLEIQTKKRPLKKQKISRKIHNTPITTNKTINKNKSKSKTQPVSKYNFIEASNYTGLSQTEFASLPSILKDIVIENVKAYNHSCKLFNKLSNINSSKNNNNLSPKEIKENALLCEAIINLMNYNSMGWDEINYWKINKKLLKKHPHFIKINKTSILQKKSIGELKYIKKNRYSNISSYKKRIQTFIKDKDTKKINNAENKIKDWQEEIVIINNIIKNKS
jgi:hypothetical protein